MVRAPLALQSTVTLRELELLFETSDFDAFPVVDGGQLTGFVTKFDFLKAFAFTTQQLVPHCDELMELPISKVMTVKVVHVTPQQRLTRAIELMVETRARSFPVLDAAGALIGIISRQDIMRALKDATANAKS
jgi:CBS domain-containing protein